VKKTVNFDDPHTYHLYFGDDIGRPGTLITFFPWTKNGLRGRKGVNQISAFAYSIPDASVGFWLERLRSFGIEVRGPMYRFDEEVVTFADPDGFEVELVASPNDLRSTWNSREVPARHSLRGFHSVTLRESSPEKTGEFLTSSLGFQLHGESGDRTRFHVAHGSPGALVDLVRDPMGKRGSMGIGVIHHVAWRAPTNESQLAIRATLDDDGADVTPVVDRSYFQSIYFHEPGGVLFEIATDPPGFLTDETYDQLGGSLRLPKWLEQYRSDIEGTLPAIIPHHVEIISAPATIPTLDEKR